MPAFMNCFNNKNAKRLYIDTILDGDFVKPQ